MTYKELKATVLSLDDTSFEDLHNHMKARIALTHAIEHAKERVLEAQQEALQYTQKKMTHEEELKAMLRECQR